MSGSAFFSRRALLASGGAALALTALSLPSGRAATAKADPGPNSATASSPVLPPLEVELVARQRQARILPAPADPSPVITYGDDFPGPVIRLKKGQRLRATLVNELAEHTSIHWHGIRLPNGEDGVPYLTQPPVQPGARHVYEFTPPDAGTYFFHPHCNTIELLARGLAGVLLVDEDGGPTFDADLVCAVKSWPLEADGRFGTISTDRGAARSGTFGTVVTVNGAVVPTLDMPANGDIRLRLLNVDSSRVIVPRLQGIKAHIIAVDGFPITPTPLEDWRMGPAMRLDVVFRAPKTAGRTIRLLNLYASEPAALAVLRTVGTPRANARFQPKALPAANIAKPDLKNARTLRFDFSSTAVAQVLDNPETLPYADSLCLSNRTFWAINQASWPDASHQRLPPPLAVLERGTSYILELANLTPHLHPIHIHGYTFLVLGSDKRTLPRHHADTVLLEPKERMRVALVADNPGDWMFHCHIIEHQETGMMGFLRVV